MDPQTLAVSDGTGAAAPSSPVFDGVPGSLQPLSFPRPRLRMSDAVFDQLSEAIRSLQLPPGTPITEPGIAAALGVGRSPVREAFTRLVDLGLITVIPQVGSSVAPISLREVEEAVFIRSALETKAFRRALENGIPDTTEIQNYAHATKAAAAAKDMEAYFNSDEQLHQCIFSLAGIPHLWQVVRGTKMQLDRLRRLNLATAVLNPVLDDEHQGIVDALRTGDLAGGIKTIETHSERIFEVIDTHRGQHPTFFTD